MVHMERPGAVRAATGAGIMEAGRLSNPENTAPYFGVQGVLDRAWHHEWPAEALGAAIALRFDPPRCWFLAIGGMMAIPPEDREVLCETGLADLRAGQPVPPFMDLRAQARAWAEWASPAERKAYMAACWQRLPAADHAAFWRTMKSRRAS